MIMELRLLLKKTEWKNRDKVRLGGGRGPHLSDEGLILNGIWDHSGTV